MSRPARIASLKWQIEAMEAVIRTTDWKIQNVKEQETKLDISWVRAAWANEERKLIATRSHFQFLKDSCQRTLALTERVLMKGEYRLLQWLLASRALLHLAYHLLECCET